MLLFDLWDRRRASGLLAEGSSIRDLKEVIFCLDVLKAAESRWRFSGRMWSALYLIFYLLQD